MHLAVRHISLLCAHPCENISIGGRTGGHWGHVPPRFMRGGGSVPPQNLTAHYSGVCGRPISEEVTYVS